MLSSVTNKTQSRAGEVKTFSHDSKLNGTPKSLGGIVNQTAAALMSENTAIKTKKPPRSVKPRRRVRPVSHRNPPTQRIRDYPSTDPLLEMHCQIGIDDCSTDLGLRGLPLFKGLIGPMPEGKNIVRYESPDVFESLTKEWTSAKSARKPRRRMQAPEHLQTENRAQDVEL